MNTAKSWKIKRNAKGYVVKWENKGNAENSSRVLESLEIHKAFYVIKNL